MHQVTMGFSYNQTFLILIFFLIQFSFSFSKSLSYSPPLIPPHDPLNHFECSYHQSLSLFHFKQQLIIKPSIFPFDDCELNGQSPEAKTMSWNMSVDCCKWKGVTCDPFNGDVIGLDLSCSQLVGTIHPNSSLFQLSHLKQLNLAFNDFSLSPISPRFGQFASLTHLNLSSSKFIGNVPSEIFLLSNLVSLDLSHNWVVQIEPNNFQLILQNLTQLRELSLAYVDLSSAKFPLNFSSALTLLDLSATGLQGIILKELLHLPNLQKLILKENPDLSLIGLSPNETIVSISSPLRYLDLTHCNISGTLPQWLGNLKQITHLGLSDNNFSGGLVPDVFAKLQQLSHLDLAYNGFTGPLPSSIVNLTQLVRLRLSNNFLTGSIPSSIGKLTQLVELSLYNNSLTGAIPSSIGCLTQLVKLYLHDNSLASAIPSSIGNLTQLVELDLSDNYLTGAIPSSVGNLTQLRELHFDNNFLTGDIPTSINSLTQITILLLLNNLLTGPIPISIIGAQSLIGLDLSDNKLNGTIPSWLFKHPSLVYLNLTSNQLTGPLEEFQNNLELKVTSLGDNQLSGYIPRSISRLENLEYLELPRNNFTGFVELNMFSNLWLLDLSYNNLSVRTTKTDINTTSFPNISILRLSSCKVKEIPYLLWSKKTLGVLDLRQNNLQGPLPSNICNLIGLEILDLSQNYFSGEIPPCLGNFSAYLLVLNLEQNNFHGNIPTTFVQGNYFRNLNFNGNQLGGKLPRSLANCGKLEVLDVGNNHIIDTFPAWLGSLLELKVLVLKSNRFRGFIPNTVNTDPFFSKLHIIDLSNNEFSGLLPSEYFKKFEAMMHADEDINRQVYMGTYDLRLKPYEDSVTVVDKGTERELVRILTMFTTIDFSNNKFQGEIPKFIGNLKSLRGLNLSHNKLVGHIPPLLGKLSLLESLDLSSNQLDGEIPQLLSDIPWLAVLNLSQNHLSGRIPQGKQFNTFDNSSYSGNLALCGFPVSKDCGGDEKSNQLPPPKLQEDDESDFKSGFTWKSVSMGYGCGTIFGLVVGYLMFSTGKPKWLIGLVENHGNNSRTRRGRQRRNYRSRN